MASEDFENALANTAEIQLTTTGRITGRESSRPVWFVRRNNKIYLLPVTGSDSQWYKNLLANPTVRLAADGAEHTATARPIQDPAEVEEVVDAFHAKYGADDVKAYYPKTDVAVEVPLD
ncbi:MAG TPA: nitroreductase/quinone reductase family protein [Solirubrobacteraceae bacterium]|jgi:deazaflavin-dependent oxidoreductase (nitroreductase family)